MDEQDETQEENITPEVEPESEPEPEPEPVVEPIKLQAEVVEEVAAVKAESVEPPELNIFPEGDASLSNLNIFPNELGIF